MNSVVTAPVCEPLHLDEVKNHLRVDGTDDDTLISSLIRAARIYCEKFQNRSYVTQTRKLTLDGFPNEFELGYCPVDSVSSITYIDSAGDTQTLSSSYYDTDATSEPARIVEAYSYSWPGIRGDINSVEVTYIAGYASKVTVVADTDVFTISGKTLSDNDVIRFSNSGGSLPKGLSADTDYYVISASGSTFKVSISEGGEAVDITDTGSGITFVGEIPASIRSAMLLLTGHLYENRENTSPLTINRVPFAAKDLLIQERVF